MHFTNRTDAGLRLAKALLLYKGSNAVVYALPRSGVPIGITIAEELQLPFDLVVASRITNPDVPNRSIGAITNTGDIVYDEKKMNRIDANWLNWSVLFAQRDVERKKHLTDGRVHISPRHRTAIIVDSGAASGMAMRAVLRTIRAEQPYKIIVALPVADHEAIKMLRHKADIIITLDDQDLSNKSVASFYDHFRRLTDQEVSHMIKQHDAFARITGSQT